MYYRASTQIVIDSNRTISQDKVSQLVRVWFLYPYHYKLHSWDHHHFRQFLIRTIGRCKCIYSQSITQKRWQIGWKNLIIELMAKHFIYHPKSFSIVHVVKVLVTSFMFEHRLMVKNQRLYLVDAHSTLLCLQIRSNFDISAAYKEKINCVLNNYQMSDDIFPLKI